MQYRLYEITSEFRGYNRANELSNLKLHINFNSEQERGYISLPPFHNLMAWCFLKAIRNFDYCCRYFIFSLESFDCKRLVFKIFFYSVRFKLALISLTSYNFSNVIAQYSVKFNEAQSSSDRRIEFSPRNRL